MADTPTYVESEFESRKAAFKALAPSLAGKRVVLYGTGKNARAAVDSRPAGDFFIGVVGDEASWNQYGGLQAIGWDRALGLSPELVVIAANMISTREVFERIGPDCRQRGIRVIDLYGNDLAQLEAEVSAATKTVGELESLMGSYDAVCFPALPIVAQEFSFKYLRHELLGNTVPAIAALFKRALKLGKAIAIITDPAESLSEVNWIAHIAPEAVFIPDRSWGVTNENGLFRIVRNSFPGKSIMYVGNREFCNSAFREIYCPRVHGIDGFTLLRTSPTRIPGDHPATSSSLQPENGTERMIARVLESGPRHPRSSAYRAGYRCLGPLVAGHALWLARSVAGQGYDGVLFAARDAYATYEAYRMLVSRAFKTAPEPVYLHTSRLAAILPLLSHAEVRAFLQTESPGIFQGLETSARQASRNRQGCLRYFSKAGLKMGGRYAFVDLVASGTCQRLLQEYAPFEMHGYYLSRRSNGFFGIDEPIESFFTRFDGPLSEHLMTVEALLSSDEPSVDGFDDDGTLIMARELRSEGELSIVRDAHEGALEFCADVFDGLDGSGYGTPRPSFVEALFAREFDSDVTVPTFNSLTKLPQEDVPAPDAVHPAQSVPSPSRTVQDALLSVLSAFDEVCRSFGLTYIATHGTLLGAVRHGGFVPWDDDLDVAMPRKDYDTLLELAEQGVFPPPFLLQTPENDPSCFHGGYAKLRDTSAATADPQCDDPDSETGVWMDIMPLDNCPLNQATVNRKRKLVRVWQRALQAKTYGALSLWGTDPYKVSAYYALGDKLSRETLCRNLRRACASGKATGLLAVFACKGNWKDAELRYDAEDVGHARRVPFENTSIPIPRNAEPWLAAYYGDDWRALPDGHQGKIHQQAAVFTANAPADAIETGSIPS